MAEILKSLEDEYLKKWGFVIVRCTYSDEGKWDAFMSEIKKQTLGDLERNPAPLATALKESLQWTIIEDRENLDNATMLQASLRFQEWTKTDGVQEIGIRFAPAQRVEWALALYPRYTLYIYVDADAVESVVNPARAKELTGYYVTLVRLNINLIPEDDDDSEAPDESLRRIRADMLIAFYLAYMDINRWYDAWQAPPRVHGNGLFW